MFQQPAAGGDQIKVAELIGSLCLFYVHEFKQSIVTSYGPSDAIAADVHVLQGPKAGESFENTLIFQKALIGSLKGAVGGEPVLARVGTGIAKPGQSAPYVLQPHTTTDAAVATAWIQARVSKVQQPAPAPATTPSLTPPGIDTSTLPPEVVELLRQSGQLPPF